ncbi:DUF4349 domain-containing protein [uncultured Algimonas sp.]|uniref:DUF4349 domain-containing protein n=1 Tax=uncultured Algimonas sp. TaxID=1547920 RepID=UPI00260BECC7|nr:DUF4349 domain-containing protein [uncultured Algimonas sp.]
MYDLEASDVRSVKRGRRQVDEIGGGEIDSSASMLAYRYTYGVTLPAPAVEPAMRAHMQRCLDTGPATCQVLNASSQDSSEDYSSAFLSLRAAPGWLDAFRNGLEESVQASDGRISSSSVSAEDLTRQIVDADARLKAQTALRKRLLTLLETRDGELQDLLAVERELARVQAQIESATALLKTLRQRVSMSVLDLRYESRKRAVSTSAVSPIGDSLRNFVRTVSQGLAAVIGFIAVALPWLVFVILPGLLLLRWLLRRWRRLERSAKPD